MYNLDDWLCTNLISYQEEISQQIDWYIIMEDAHQVKQVCYRLLFKDRGSNINISMSYKSLEKYNFLVKLKESKDEYRIFLTLSYYTPIFIANNVVVAS